jgi:hypothetical protein
MILSNRARSKAIHDEGPTGKGRWYHKGYWGIREVAGFSNAWRYYASIQRFRLLNLDRRGIRLRLSQVLEQTLALHGRLVKFRRFYFLLISMNLLQLFRGVFGAIFELLQRNYRLKADLLINYSSPLLITG